MPFKLLFYILFFTILGFALKVSIPFLLFVIKFLYIFNLLFTLLLFPVPIKIPTPSFYSILFSMISA